MNTLKERLLEKIAFVYGEEKADDIYTALNNLMEKYKADRIPKDKQWVDEKDVMLITYGDNIKEKGKSPLKSLKEFLQNNVKDVINSVHILPFYPYSSDDGFSVIDYRKVNPELGTWEDIQHFSKEFYLMFDGVINHISKESDWFQGYLKGDTKYRRYFIEADPKQDYSSVTRPRALPLLTKFRTSHGEKFLWTTFSDDQIDLNYENEEVLLEIIDILLTYAKLGARYIRLDAIGYLWKKIGTSCIHLDETHTIIQLIRDVLDEVYPGTIIITETNVPHKDNISYFGNGYNEAHMVYQFPLPPLTLYSFLSGNAKYLTKWAQSLEPTSNKTTFFNFLASHDGIGVRPAEGILSEQQIEWLCEKVKEHQGFVSYKDNGDGTQSPYELNINYLDALSHPDDAQELKVKRFIAAQSILFSMIGVPGIYIHSLLGSQNDHEGVKETGRYRSINREKLCRNQLEEQLSNPDSLRYQVFHKIKELLKIRINQSAFHPNGEQRVLELDKRVFSLIRKSIDGRETILSFTNVSNEEVTIQLNFLDLNLAHSNEYMNLLTNEKVIVQDSLIQVVLKPYEVAWLKNIEN